VSVSAADRLKRDKRALRARVRAERAALAPDVREHASFAIADTVLTLPEVVAASTAMVFASFGTEVDTAPIITGLAERGTRIALPRVEDRDLAAVVFRPGDALVIAAFGMPEPSAGEIVAPRELDVAITPGLAFDRAGYRVGYGGGFYDRFFAAAREDLVKVGVCFWAQLVQTVPHGAFDVPVDVVVTERGIARGR
jgi:5-formyltetrahydrofolate cyclo-ligase